MSESITLRLAGARDAQAIAIMSRERIEVGLGWRYRPDAVRRLIAEPDTVVLVACERERLAGFAIMEFGDERAHLVLLAVGAGYQRRGIGRRLIEWLFESAATAGIAAVHLELRADNAVARSFYRAVGFRETARVTGYYSGSAAALRMCRVLRAASAASVEWRAPRFGRR